MTISEGSIKLALCMIMFQKIRVDQSSGRRVRCLLCVFSPLYDQQIILKPWAHPEVTGVAVVEFYF